MNSALEARQLTRYYGRVRGIENVDLKVEPGEIFGLLGPNGAGKTTTIRLLLDFIRPTSGSAQLLGLDSRRDSKEIRRRVGYLQGDFASYSDLTPRQLANYFGHLRGGGIGNALAYMDRLDLEPDRKFGVLSKGNRQKVGLVQALMSEPELLILDEPTSGLDPLMQREFREVMAELKSEGRTVFLSSHDLSEAESVCDRVAIIRDGHIVAVESIETLRRRTLRSLSIEFAEPADPASFAGLANVRDVSVDGPVLTCKVTGSVDAVIKAAARNTVLNITAENSSLEEIFMNFYEGDSPQGDDDAE